MKSVDVQWVCHTADSTSCDLFEGDVILQVEEKKIKVRKNKQVSYLSSASFFLVEVINTRYHFKQRTHQAKEQRAKNKQHLKKLQKHTCYKKSDGQIYSSVYYQIVLSMLKNRGGRE